MEKVTQKLEQGSPEVLEELGRAIRKIHGTRDPDLEQEVFLRTLKAFRKERRSSIRGHSYGRSPKTRSLTIGGSGRGTVGTPWTNSSTRPPRTRMPNATSIENVVSNNCETGSCDLDATSGDRSTCFTWKAIRFPRSRGFMERRPPRSRWPSTGDGGNWCECFDRTRLTSRASSDFEARQSRNSLISRRTKNGTPRETV